MAYIEKVTENKFILHVYIKPNSKIQETSEDDDLLIIKIKSKPRNFKANKELLRFLKRKLNLRSDHISIISGIKNQKKILQVIFPNKIDKEEIRKRIVS